MSPQMINRVNYTEKAEHLYVTLTENHAQVLHPMHSYSKQSPSHTHLYVNSKGYWCT